MTKKKRKYQPPDFEAELERLLDERDAAHAEASRLWVQYCEKYLPEIEELIRFGEERGHAWASPTGRTGLFSPRTPEEIAEAEAMSIPVMSRERFMLSQFHSHAEELNRYRDLQFEISRLERKIEETWENALLFGRPRVINLKDKPRPEPSEYVYIGRGLRAGKERFERSKWANPYTVKRYGPAEALKRYEELVRSGPLWDELPKLAAEMENGKPLACWCKPERCHGDVLLRLIEEHK